MYAVYVKLSCCLGRCTPCLSGVRTPNTDPSIGVIRTRAPLDREQVAHYWLTVQAEDRGLRPLSAVTEVYIEVVDVNDNPPRVSSPVFYPSVREDVPPHSPVLQLEAQDADAGPAGRLRFNLTGGNALGLFTLDPDTGGKAGWGRRVVTQGCPRAEAKGPIWGVWLPGHRACHRPRKPSDLVSTQGFCPRRSSWTGKRRTSIS